MNNLETFYHGSCHLFKKFSLSFLGSGEGKSKFGQGIYITSSYKTAALYASKAAKANGKDSCYVYTLEVPVLTKDNHIFSCKAVNASVVERVEKELGGVMPDEVKVAGNIVEDESNRRKKPDSWGAILDTTANEYYGKNIMGRLLMELREKGVLEYHHFEI
ncbi:MAG: hypothetical protein J6V55_04965 [Alistipes sp.]|nr:hypothetical protein [Alistipes sp.]